MNEYMVYWFSRIQRVFNDVNSLHIHLFKNQSQHRLRRQRIKRKRNKNITRPYNHRIPLTKGNQFKMQQSPKIYLLQILLWTIIFSKSNPNMERDWIEETKSIKRSRPYNHQIPLTLKRKETNLKCNNPKKLSSANSAKCFKWQTIPCAFNECRSYRISCRQD